MKNNDAVDLAEKEVNKQYEEQLKKVSEEIQKILEENKMALQPSLAISQYGILPRVNLVRMPDKDGE